MLHFCKELFEFAYITHVWLQYGSNVEESSAKQPCMQSRPVIY